MVLFVNCLFFDFLKIFNGILCSIMYMKLGNLVLNMDLFVIK